jgi:hypothetical protein
VHPSISVPPSFRPAFSVSNAVSTSIQVLVARPLPFLALCLVQLLPAAAVYGALYAGMDAEQIDALGKGAITYPTWFWYAYAPLMMSFVVSFSATMHAAVEHLQGRPIAIGKSLTVGLVRFLPLVAVYFLFSLAMMLGFIALIIPGLLVMTVLFMSIPVAVLERRGIFGALARGAALSKGRRGTLFTIGLTWMAISIAGYFGCALIGVGLGALSNAIFQSAIGLIAGVPFWAAACFGLSALLPILIAVSYHGLRQEKDGPSGDQVADVFA